MEFVGAAKDAAIIGLPVNLFLPLWEKETAQKELKEKNSTHDQLRASCNQVNIGQEDEHKQTECLARQANEIEELKSSLVELRSELCRFRSDHNQNQQILETTSASLKDQQVHGLQTVMTSIVSMRSDLDTLRSNMATELQTLSLKLDPIVNMKEKIEAALKTFSKNHAKCSPTPLESLGVKSVISHKIDEDRCIESSVDNPIDRTVKDIFHEINDRKVQNEQDLPKSDAKNTTNHNQSCTNREHADQVAMSDKKSFPAAKPGAVDGHFFSFDTNLIIGVVDSSFQNDLQKLGAPSGAPPSDSTVVTMNCQNAAANTSLTVTSTSAPARCFKSRVVIQKRKNANGTITKPRVDQKAEVKDAVGRSDQTETGEVQVLRQPRLLFMPAEGASFTIPSTHSFYDGNGDFYTDLYFILGSPCKARLRMRLSEDGRLAVTALLSLEQTKAFKTPLYISGVGFISAKISGGGGYSKLFEFPTYAISSRHSDNEVSLEAFVFLQTRLNIYENVTYKQLVEMRYDINRNLSFNWNLKCSKFRKI